MEREYMCPVAIGLGRTREQVTEHARKLNVSEHARDWLSDWGPAKIPMQQGSLNARSAYWKSGGDYINPSETSAEAEMLAVSLVEQFARAGGHVIWIGTTSDLYRMSEQLMFKIAGLDVPTEGTEVQLNVIEHLNLIDARAEMMNMWIDFCNVEDCGDAVLEQEFVASMSSFDPTLIVVDASIFDESMHDAFDFLIRNTFGLHMVEQLRSANPLSSVLWPSTDSSSVVIVER